MTLPIAARAKHASSCVTRDGDGDRDPSHGHRHRHGQQVALDCFASAKPVQPTSCQVGCFFSFSVNPIKRVLFKPALATADPKEKRRY